MHEVEGKETVCYAAVKEIALDEAPSLYKSLSYIGDGIEETKEVLKRFIFLRH